METANLRTPEARHRRIGTFPRVAVAFATSRPGETLADFKHRLKVGDHYPRTRGVELVFDREAATELVRLLIPVVGRTEIGLLIDSP